MGLNTAAGVAKHLHRKIKDDPSTKEAARAARSIAEGSRKLAQRVKKGESVSVAEVDKLGPSIKRLDKAFRTLCSNGEFA